MIKIKWSDFLDPEKKIAINCQTEEDAKELFQMMDAKGARWCDGDRIIDTETFLAHTRNTLAICSYWKG